MRTSCNHGGPGAAAGARLSSARGWLLVALLALTGPAWGALPGDPWENVNREIFEFNDAVDRWVLKPVAEGYDRVLPDRVQNGIGNVLDNLRMPLVAVNQLLQGKPGLALQDMTRFVVNSTVGIGGVFDIAARNDLPRHSEDFGQTFAVWSGGQGPFVTVPFRGPATTTHVAGMVVQVFVSPLLFLLPTNEALGVAAVDVVNTRAALLSTEQLISGDRYLFIRDAYLQNRDYEIHDGQIEDDPFLDDFGDDFEDFED